MSDTVVSQTGGSEVAVQDETEKSEKPKVEIECNCIEPGFATLKMDLSSLTDYNPKWIIVYYTYGDPPTTDDEDTIQHVSARILNLSSDATFYLKVNRAAHNYKVSIKARVETALCENGYLDLNDWLSIDIASDAAEQHWFVGQLCRFSDPTTELLTDCRITDELPNKRYRVRCTYRQYRNRDDIDIPKHRLRVNTKEWTDIIDIRDFASMDYRLIYNRSGDNEMAIDEWKSIYSQLVAIIADNIDVAVPYYNKFHFITSEYIFKHITSDSARVIAISVMSYLSEPKYEWKLGCALCAADGIQSYVRRGTRLYYGGSESTLCDECMCQMSHAPGYYCLEGSHDYCMDCVYGTVNKYQYWSDTLTPLLQDFINLDCVLEIVSLLAGVAIPFHVQSK